MSGIPDYPLGETLDFKFTTRAFATGIPTTLAGTPVVDIYEDNDTTQITGAETLTVDFDAVTGLNNLRVVATSGNGFESGKSYQAVITTGTVGGVSVVGEVVAQFTIERSPALRPTTVGRTLDVTATGEAGIDLDNTSGTIVAAQIATDAITADKVAADAIDASALATDAVNEIRDAVLNAASGTADAGSTASAIVDAARTESVTDYWQHSIVFMTSGANAGQGRRITAFNITTDTITVAPAFKSAVGTGDSYIILQTGIADGLRPITEGNETVDVAADGDVGADVQTWLDSAVNALVSGRVDASVGAMAANVLTATAIATDAITAAKIAADAIGASELATDAVNEIRDAILSDSTAFAGANIDAAISTRSSHTADAVISAASGTADAGSSATLLVDAARTESVTDYWQHSVVLMTSGVNAGQVRRITAFNTTTDTLTVAPAFKSAIGTGDGYIILRTAIADGLRPVTEGNETVDVAADGDVGADVQTWLDAAPNTLVSGRVDASVGAMAANVLTATAIATDAITAAKIAANALGASELATDAVNEIRDAMLADSTAFNGADIAAILADTGTDGVKLDMAQTLPASPTDDTTGDALKQASRIPEGIKKNTVLSDFEFVMYDSTDHITPITGRTVSGTRSIDGGAFAAVGGTFAEVGNGVYQFDAVAADTNGDLITWRFTATGADDVFITFKTTP